MKLFKFIYFTFFLLIISCSCSKKTEQTNSIKTALKSKKHLSTPKTLSTNTYKPATVCDCSKDGLKALDDMLAIRQRYEDFENYNNDYASVEKVANLQDNWVVIREVCLRKFATKLFNPSDCNEPSKIGYFKDKLNNLGISTN